MFRLVREVMPLVCMAPLTVAVMTVRGLTFRPSALIASIRALKEGGFHICHVSISFLHVHGLNTLMF